MNFQSFEEYLAEMTPKQRINFLIRQGRFIAAFRAQFHVAMSEETGEVEDVTVDEQGAVVNSLTGNPCQVMSEERARYEAWRKKEEARRETP